jgi:eukaryotic-like serine/threonine-protein kinase
MKAKQVSIIMIILVAGIVVISCCIQIDNGEPKIVQEVTTTENPITSTTGYETKSTQPAGFLKYENTKYGFSIAYPADWENTELEEKYKKAVFQSPVQDDLDSFRENLIISYMDYSSSPTTLERATESIIAGLEKGGLQNFNLIDSSETTLAGIRAHTITYTVTQSGFNLKLKQFWTIKNNKVYMVSYGELADEPSVFWDTMEEMTESFEIR